MFDVHILVWAKIYLAAKRKSGRAISMSTSCLIALFMASCSAVTNIGNESPRDAALTITTGSLPSGVKGVAYSQGLGASGGTVPYSWALSSGTLPSGLTLASNGTISGTLATSAQSGSFTVKVTDSSSPAQSTSGSISISITAATSTLSVMTTSLPSGVAGSSYSAVLSASGGTSPYSWALSSGALPSGLTLASNGTISGTLATSAQSGSFTVKVTDSSSPTQSTSGSLSISITSASSALAVATTSLPSGIVGSAYSSALNASGGTPPYSWVVSSGSLPAGLTLTSNGTISGTPTASAPSSFTVKVTDSSSPVQSASALLAISISSAVTATPGATATQYVLPYTATGSSQCVVEVSTSPTYSPLVHAVDSAIFANANRDGQTTSGPRAFVIGQKWIGQENVTVPWISAGAASRAANSKLVTVSYPNQPFVAGDNITITGMSNSAYNDSWARVDVASTNSFSYEVPTAAPSGGDSSAGGIITRANRYSLALAANTTYYYRIGGASNTCGASPATGSFTTMNIPNGNTWEERPVQDNNGNQIFPTVPESRTASLVDPLTGATVNRISLFSDTNSWARGWSSSFYRPCTLTTSSNGFYHCVVGLGDSGTGGLYSIKGTGETHWLGLMHFSYTESANHACCQQGMPPYIGGDSASSSTTDANTFYAIAATNAGYPPTKNVIVSIPFTGNDSADAASAANMSTSAATALTPDPSNTLTDKFAAFDSSYIPARYNGCRISLR